MRQHAPETVARVTEPAARRIQRRPVAGVQPGGLPQRLDVSHRDDPCRLRLPQSMRVIGMFRRISTSLFLHWRSRQKKPRHKTPTDFFGAMNAEHHRYDLPCLQARQPSFLSSS